MSTQRLPNEDDVALCNRLIAQCPVDAQRRIQVIAAILRDLIAAEGGDEVELAFTLVMAELST